VVELEEKVQIGILLLSLFLECIFVYKKCTLELEGTSAGRSQLAGLHGPVRVWCSPFSAAIMLWDDGRLSVSQKGGGGKARKLESQIGTETGPGALHSSLERQPVERGPSGLRALAELS